MALEIHQQPFVASSSGFENLPKKALVAAGSPDPSEDRVMAQLVAALIFERLVACNVHPLESHEKPPGETDAVFDLALAFAIGARRFRCIAAIGAFERVRVSPGSIEVLEAAGPRPCRLTDLLEPLEVHPVTRARLREELEQTVALCRWNRANLPHLREPRRHLDFQRLESVIVEGHPYHPCFKTRTGFSLADHRAYGPESGNEFQLEWLAVPRASVRTALPADEASFFRAELGDAHFDSLRARLELRSGDLSSYALLPVHPWQLASLRSRGLTQRGRAAEILALGAAGDRYRATQSVRTLVNVNDETKANVKVPLDIICTSSHRNLLEHFVCTAPPISEWVAALVDGDPFLRERGHLLILREYAAALFDADEPLLIGRIGVVFRESVCGKLEPGESAVPFNALALVEADGRPFVADWIAAYGAQRWVDRLLDVMLVPLWHVLVHHGVAFESHAQNLILIHRDGWPMKVALRDFHDTTEFVQDFLRSPERLPDLARIDPHFATVADDDGYRMASVEDLRELFMDTVYVFNLADLSFLFARYLGFPEESFWHAVRRCLDDYALSGVTAASRIARVACGKPEIAVESLLKKKLLDGGVLDFYEHHVQNQLHG